MLIESLSLYHSTKLAKLKLNDLAELCGESFYFESCLRSLILTLDNPPPTDLTSVEIYRGVNAYRFLLQVATGLESPISGETEIFGQLKQSWAHFQALNKPLASRLRPLMEKLFSDAKSIRSQFLQGIGGSSYGSLARKIIAPDHDDEITLVGAGQLASEVAPLFAEWKMNVWARDQEKLGAFAKSVAKHAPRSLDKLNHETLLEKARTKGHVIICVPHSADVGTRLLEERARSQGPIGKTVHLGGFSNELSSWASLPNFFSLSEILELDKSQDELRSSRLKRAKEACIERAQHRELNETYNLLHGWEDLSFTS